MLLFLLLFSLRFRPKPFSRNRPTNRHGDIAVIFRPSLGARLNQLRTAWRNTSAVPYPKFSSSLGVGESYYPTPCDILFWLQDATRCSSSCSRSRYSHSRKRDRHSSSSNCWTATPHGSHAGFRLSLSWWRTCVLLSFLHVVYLFFSLYLFIYIAARPCRLASARNALTLFR